MNIILFWSSQLCDNETYDSWKNKTIDLSLFHELTLHSQVKFNKNVFLLTYQKLSDKIKIPDTVQIIDASEYYPPERAYESMKRGHSIAHISDLVRFRYANITDGVILDMDAVAIKELPNIHAFISTHLTKLTGGLVIKFGEKHPPFKTDGSWDGKALSVFPFKVHSSISSQINELCTKIEESLDNTPKTGTKAWNYIMWKMKDIANSNDIFTIMKPIHCCPVPAWKSVGNCYSLDYPTKFDGESKLFGNQLPSLDEIFRDGYIVQHFFESAFKNSNGIESDFWKSVKDNSLLHREIIHVFGSEWLKEKRKSEFDEW